jgi:hypothetical protein
MSVTVQATFNVVYSAILIDDTPPPINRYSTQMTSQIDTLTPHTTTYETDYIDGTSVTAKNSVFTFNLATGGINGTDTYTSTPVRIISGNMSFFTPGPNTATVNINIHISSSTNFSVDFSQIGFTFVGLGPNFGGSVAVNGGTFDTQRSVSISADALCLHGDSIVHTTKGFVKIKDLSVDDVYLIDLDGNPVKLVQNVKLLDATKFVIIEKCALGENEPSEDMYIIDGHPIFIDNKEVLPIKLINGKNIRYVDLEPTPIYTLVTENRIFVKVNNINICTWAIKDINKKLFNIIHTNC